ncbi:MAG: lamin tail domain-containing protein [Treponema sp.]|nr:lamin tail domain-containing protein [Treponema sp.]MCL2237124.1 lamin tail domain-containing protein [Treponema sp.]
MKKIKKTILIAVTVMLAALLSAGCEIGPRNTGEDETSQYEGKLLILQAYGNGALTDGSPNGVSHSFIELYNTTNQEINLDGISLFYANGTRSTIVTEDEPWNRISLNGCNIPAKSSFLVLGAKHGNTSSTRYIIDDNYGDINDNNLVLSRRAFKIALIENADELTVQNPFNVDGAGKKANGYIDMVGAANEYEIEDLIFGFEIYPARNSASAAVRRKNLNDTDENSEDFVSLDYRMWTSSNQDRMTDEQLVGYKPKNSEYGAWNPVTGEKTGNTAVNVTISGTGVSSGELGLLTEKQVSLSARIEPLDADKTGITYSWSVSDESEPGIITPASGTGATFTITAVKEGTATVTVVISGGGITTVISNNINVTVTAPTWPTGSPKLMILQIATGSTNNDGNVSHSFVELFNNTASPIVLNGTYSLQYATGTRASSGVHNPDEDSEWQKIDLEGTIQPYHSFLILGDRISTMPSPALDITDNSGDMNVSGFILSNRSVKVVLMANQTLLDAVNPFTNDGQGGPVDGYVDMVGVINSSTGNSADKIRASEGELTFVTDQYRISAQIALRRTSLIDTDVNTDDFRIIQYNNTNPTVPENLKDFAYPKNQVYGAWNPITGGNLD